ncbi:MAG: hypothetical protein ABR577_13840 [Pyrinomonadaceae bacterium]
MPPKFLNKLVAPQLPAAAVGLSRDTASAVLLERRRRRNGVEFELRRAAAITLPENLIAPDFDEQNILDTEELADALAELVTSAGLARQRKWSVALPEAATRTAILTLEGDQQTSRAETEELLRWKSERAFGVPLDELRVRRERLAPDARGRARFLAAGVRLSVVAEYEAVFMRLGWQAGLILPRHVGEARWLMPQTAGRSASNGGGDALLVSSHAAGFTAVLLHGAQPLIVRAVSCDEEDCADELYRLLLFYRDRAAAKDVDPANEAGETMLRRLLVVGGNGGESVLSRERVSEVVNETLGANVRALDAAAIGLTLPPGELNFDDLAAPAGLATLAWQ